MPFNTQIRRQINLVEDLLSRKAELSQTVEKIDKSLMLSFRSVKSKDVMMITADPINRSYIIEAFHAQKVADQLNRK